MILRSLVLSACLIAYGTGFILLDQRLQDRPVELQLPPPLQFLQATTGYLRQITAVMLFIRTSVFLGGVQAGVDKRDYETALSQNLKTMTSLYPEFIDPYFFTQSFLTHISKYSAEEAIAILETGIKTFPEDFTLRFFHAFTYFRYLNAPLKAAEAFEEAAKIKDAPPFFARLAAIFSGHGGNLSAGLTMLQILLQGEYNEVVRERYIEEISLFEKAITVENAIAA